MQLRWRDMPLYLFGVLCWVWVIACAGSLVAAVLFAVLWQDFRDVRSAWKPVAAATPAVVAGWLVVRHFLKRVEPLETETASDPPGFDVLPPR